MVRKLIATGWTVGTFMCGAAEIFVSPEGLDHRDGSAAAPVRTIERAEELAKPGDTIRLAPGLYRGRLRITRSGAPGKPITIAGTRGADGACLSIVEPEAVEPGKWTSEYERKLYYLFRAPMPERPDFVLIDGRSSAFAKEGDAGFDWLTKPRMEMFEDGGASGPVLALMGNAICCWRDGFFYVRLPDYEAPHLHTILATRGSAVTVDGASHRVFRDLLVRNAREPFAIAGARDVVVERCFLAHGRSRVRIAADATGVVIRENEMSAALQQDDRISDALYRAVTGRPAPRDLDVENAAADTVVADNVAVRLPGFHKTYGICLGTLDPAQHWRDAPEGSVARIAGREVHVHRAVYDESKLPEYTLEDPLTVLDGTKVTKETWQKRRREILGIFAKEMFGEEPPVPGTLITDLVDEKEGAAAGYAVRRQYRMYFRPDRTGPCINWILWTPRHAKKPVPVILMLNFDGNHSLVCDPEIPLCGGWFHNRYRAAMESNRGLQRNEGYRYNFPLGVILSRGYAVLTACYADVSPDPEDVYEPHLKQQPFAYTGVFELWGERDESRDDNTTAIGAWAWALSRGLDLAERIPDVDAKRSVVTGCSRLGKTALLAAARDERFAICVPNQTGAGGVPLAKRGFGENVSTECRQFTHWFCKAYAKYARAPHELLTFDQHMLLACVAPRPLLVEGFNSNWFDPKGEFLSVRAASPVWEFLTGEGLPEGDIPEPFETRAIGRDLGYVRRTERHGIADCDWMWLIDFADAHFGKGYSK